MTPFQQTTVDGDADENFVSDWFNQKGPLIPALQGIWGGATMVKLVARFDDKDPPAGEGSSYPVLAVFTPESLTHVELIYTRDLPPLAYEYRWEVTDNDGDTNLHLLAGCG